ncbi:efflux RND transporter periplasmic adaptor subunit [Pseudoalteromonas sp. SSDWG2]|uniref:efflux RND transporter periplasmic adaptor subunit n=1 Tax=Pseudoalteromonas sp. SSDWG2 TaxID=3139391 RepID=UPI003BAB931A
MKAKITLILVVCFLAVAIVLFSGVFNQHITPGNKEQTSQYTGLTHTIEYQQIDEFEMVPGRVIAQQNTTIAARVLAQIEQLPVRSGDEVKQGQVLVRLDQQELNAQWQQAKSQVRALEASFVQAQKQLQRAQELFSQGLVSQSDVDNAVANHDSLSASLMQAQQRQQQASVALGYATITAPISGRVVERFAKAGDTVSPGQPLLAIYNPQQLQLEFAVREQQAVNLKLGDVHRVTIPSLGLAESTELVEVVPAADSASRSLVMRFAPPTNSQLLPGLFCELALPLVPRKAILIPQSWVYSVGQLDMVLVLENAQITRRYVRLGNAQGDHVEVISGLHPGDEIALDAQLDWNELL